MKSNKDCLELKHTTYNSNTLFLKSKPKTITTSRYKTDMQAKCKQTKSIFCFMVCFLHATFWTICTVEPEWMTPPRKEIILIPKSKFLWRTKVFNKCSLVVYDDFFRVTNKKLFTTCSTVLSPSFLKYCRQSKIFKYLN